MDIDKTKNKLNLWRHRTLVSLNYIIISAISIGLSVGLQKVFLNIFLNYISAVFSILATVSLIAFVFSIIKQAAYEEKMVKIMDQLDNETIAPEIEELNNNIEKTLTNENVKEPYIAKECKTTLPNNRVIDVNGQIEKDRNPNNNKVLQKYKKK